MAETFSCVLWVPIDVVKERLQTHFGAAALSEAERSWRFDLRRSLTSL